MRFFAWSDLHLESASNLELVKQFCKLHQKRPPSPANSTPRNPSANASCSEKNTATDQQPPVPTASEGDCDCPEAGAAPVRQSSLTDSIGKLWESLTASPTSKSEDFSEDVLILAGDVHYDLEGLKESLQLFCSVFRHVAFVPGNHEFWVTEKDKQAGIGDSVQKLDGILLLCDSLGVHTRPFTPCEGVHVVPLLSWYDEFDPHFSAAARPTPRPVYLPVKPGSSVLGQPAHFAAGGSHDQRALMSFSDNWMDYSACKWPPPLTNNDPRPANGQSLHASRHGGYGRGTVLSRQTHLRVEQNKQPDYPSCPAVSDSPPAIFITPPSADKDTCGATNSRSEAGGLRGASVQMGRYQWSAGPPKEPPRPVMAKGQTRRTTDSFGMPLSLSEFFALENERRKSGGQEEEGVPQPSGFGRGGGPPTTTNSHEARGSTAAQISGTQTAAPQGDQALHAQSAKGNPGVASRGSSNENDSSSKQEPVVITFSHFLPRAELVTIYPLNPSALAYVMGSTRIDEQLRQARSSLHVFGHSHLNADTQIDVSRIASFKSLPRACL
ncbi:hypothetical protein Efla_005006 [Eimeria flavescens]